MYGQLGQDRVWRKKIQGSKHIMRKYDAIGIDAGEFNRLPEKTELRILDSESNILYTITREHASRVKFTGEFGDHKPQYFISRSEFTKTPHEAKKQ